MSEPQHPQPQDTDTNENHPASVGRAAMQPVVQQNLDSLAAVGARLAQLRESKGWSIEDVSARLKVSAIKLRALESGDISHLPDTTFALGVVRSYAKMLGVDPVPFTQALRREKGVPAPDLSLPASSGRDLPRGKVSLSLGGGQQKSRSWLWGVAAVIVVIIALGMWHTNGGDLSAWLARLKASANGSTSGATGTSGAVAQGQSGGSEAAGAATDNADNAASAPQTQAAAANPASAVPMPTPMPRGASSSPAVTTTMAAAPKAGSQPAAAPFRITVGNKACLETLTLDGQPVRGAFSIQALRFFCSACGVNGFFDAIRSSIPIQ
ncbi:MAG: Cytoskeleton protein RodZ [uncultured Paraburkholderia sp.]|nr:MAG: Cytoskeleton protein RodZ [uncultured Paraburkholderia sp.]CAH2933711.1 MAG: Cytoskeleton protein RodZ [uncultured Paraburkholderia sp.]